MLIERQKRQADMAISCRVDSDGYYALHDLSEAVSASASVLVRLAIRDLLEKQKRINARCVTELMDCDAD